MTYKDNWLTWYYDGVEYGSKLSPTAVFDLKIKPKITRAVKSYREELLLNAALIRDTFSEPFDLLFSGGGDSEVILRCYHELKIPINVFIFKYENDYNISDVTHAVRICNELNVTPKIIDFNLQKFFEQDAYDLWLTGYYANAGKLPHMKFIEYLDNIPIMGDGIPLWDYYPEERKWKFELDEAYHGQSIYCKTIERLAISDWYEYSPEVIASYAVHPRMQSLFKNPGNWRTFEETKYIIYKSMWDQVQIRPKFVGYEGTMPAGIGSSKPNFMLEFNRTHIKYDESPPFAFTKEQLLNVFYGYE